jgi:hypothetical protein
LIASFAKVQATWSVSITCHTNWNIDTATGAWSGGVSPTYYRLTNRNSGKCLNVVGSSTADGALLEQRTCASGNNFQWTRQ